MRHAISATLLALVLLPAAAAAQGTSEHDHGAPAATAPAAHDHGAEVPAAPVARDPNLPADEAAAKDALEHSPRHGEWFDVPAPDGGAPIRTWAVWPERRDRAGVVLIVHEIFGCSDWIRAVADQFARDGFLAVVPDLLSGFGPNGGGTESLGPRDSVVAAIRLVTPALAQARLDAVRAWALAQPSANGRLATVGFCWGGARSFAYAASQPALDAAVVYYGTSPDSASLLNVRAPVLGLYGADDNRVVATVEPAQRVLRPLHRAYEVKLYDGAGHGFLRQQSGRDGANLRAARDAWPRTLAFLRRYLKTK